MNYLLIGHICHDKTSDGFTLGGAVSYSGLAAKKLGMSPTILTSVGNDFLFKNKFKKENIPLHIIPAEKTTIFENRYSENSRSQYLHTRASNLFPNDLPEKWRSPKVVQCSPICDEVDFGFLNHFPGALVGATIQGWLRTWNGTKSRTSGHSGLISPKEIKWGKLSAADVVIFSEEDIRGFESALPKIISQVEIVVMTKGENGATVWQYGKENNFPTKKIKVVDTTGAGDVFAAAFLVRFFQNNDISAAAEFANFMAGKAVEKRFF